MAHWWRYLLTITAGVAAAAPVQLQLDFDSIDLQLVRSAALAEAGDGGNGSGNGNNGNGNGNTGGNSGNGPNGNGNSGNGNGGGKGGNGNAGNGNSASGNSGNGNAGASNGAGGRSEGNGGGGGSSGNGAGQGGGGGGTSSGANPGGSNSDSRGDARGRSGEAAGRSRNASGGAGKANGLARGHNSWIGYEVRTNQPGTGRSAKPAAKSRTTGAGKEGKVSAHGGIGQAKKGAAARTDGKAASGVTSRSASSPSGGKSASRSARPSSRAGTVPTVSKDHIMPMGTPSKPRQALNSIVASGLTEQDLAKLSAVGLHVTSQTRGLVAPRVVRLRLPGGMTVAEAQQAVQRISRQASTDADSYYYTDGGAPGCTDPGCEVSRLVGWTPPSTDACGMPPLIGLIDTGIDLDHEALRGQSIELLNVSGEPGRSSSLDHGTAIAALLVGRADSATPGLVPQARLVAVDAFSKGDGTADRADVVSLVSALEALADRGVKIVNLSLSGPPNEVLRKAVEAAHAKAIVLVAAAGNNGAGAEPSYPAAYPGVIAVTAVDRQLNVYRRATRGPYVAFSAPGVEIRTAQASGASAAKSGTSYAVPFVSAALAMMRAARPETDVEKLQMRLQDNTRDLGAPGRDPTFGYGLVQMANLCSAPGEVSPIPVVGGTLAPDQRSAVRY